MKNIEELIGQTFVATATRNKAIVVNANLKTVTLDLRIGRPLEMPLKQFLSSFDVPGDLEEAIIEIKKKSKE